VQKIHKLLVLFAKYYCIATDVTCFLCIFSFSQRPSRLDPVGERRVQTTELGSVLRRAEDAEVERDPRDAPLRGLELEQTSLTCRARVGETAHVSVLVKNRSGAETRTARVATLAAPFHCRLSKFRVRPRRWAKLPVEFRPLTPGRFTACLLVTTIDEGITTPVTLHGHAD